MRKINKSIIGIILAVVLLGAAGFGLFVSQNELSSTRGDLSDTQSELSVVTNSLDETEAALQAAQGEINFLEGSRSVLEENAQELSGELDDTVALLEDERAAYTALSDERDSLLMTILSLELDKARLAVEIRALRNAHESVLALEEKADGLRTVIAGLEDDRKALEVKSREMFPVCTGSMEPKITCLDNVVLLENFHPEDIAVGTVISYDPSTVDGAGGDGLPILHRVANVKIENDVYYFWPKGDAQEDPDGIWVPQDSVLGYVIELRQGARPENTDLRDWVNGARERYTTARDTMLEARDAFDAVAIQYCGSVEAASSCDTSSANFSKVTTAYAEFSTAWDVYLTAICEYDEAYYHGLHQSEPLDSEDPFSPYVAPAVCSPAS